MEPGTWVDSAVSEKCKIKVVQIGFVLKVVCCLTLLHGFDSVAELTATARATNVDHTECLRGGRFSKPMWSLSPPVIRKP